MIPELLQKILKDAYQEVVFTTNEKQRVMIINNAIKKAKARFPECFIKETTSVEEIDVPVVLRTIKRAKKKPV